MRTILWYNNNMAQVSLNELVAQTYRGVYGVTIPEAFQTANQQIRLHAEQKLRMNLPVIPVTANKETVFAD